MEYYVLILHEDKNQKVFDQVIRFTAAEFNVPQAYVEKDYFLTKSLLNLSQSSDKDCIVFKGGTSLSKIYKVLFRFSEDIDLAIIPEKEWGDNKIKRVVKRVVKNASKDLEETGEQFNSGSKFKKVRVRFPLIDPNQDLGEVQKTILIECNAFTTPSPIEKKPVRTLIAEWAIRSGNSDIIEEFNLQDFEINVLCWKRTLCEKILGLMAASTRDLLQDKVRHFYDITLMLRHNEIKEFTNSDCSFFKMMGVAVQNDINHAGRFEIPWINSDIGLNQPFNEFEISWKLVEEAYYGDFEKMVTRPERSPGFDEISAAFSWLQTRLVSYSNSSFHQDCLRSMS
ncbi:nucleotidyl transferase AbiEii/AbiGii toxin family protein [Pseudoalteromonas sp. Angola-4]|uniref:nucleotidyl transferase AbiEii/AbiGii toxin family protein n=1 Tax=Pseudoalteromonas sp. Angola-4 TaxID=3025335 RepID=UPI0023598F06|nr:nucleotidyl transferase AbiEii/AbiGii toxin family protein [Pseudoalteromonas sp. Angola-4]MDC9508938.1 nucleotidyl transferase AbiEii/AbiGii toxin family protein [Pseudoalteromonas sp. Angola-4]